MCATNVNTKWEILIEDGQNGAKDRDATNKIIVDDNFENYADVRITGIVQYQTQQAKRSFVGSIIWATDIQRTYCQNRERRAKIKQNSQVVQQRPTQQRSQQPD